MTQETFKLLDYCTNWLPSSFFGIFQDKWLKSVVRELPVEENFYYSGMWLYVRIGYGCVNRISFIVANHMIKLPSGGYLFLYKID